MPDETFDYIVIGSGSAGGVVAARLTEDPDVRVLLLEAGPADDDDNIHIPLAFSALFKTRWDWNYETTPQKHLGGRRAYWPRMKALGGCSSMNAMIYIRGNHADYDEWRDAYGATGWGFDDVMPYFRKAEHNTRLGGAFHGSDGPLHVEHRTYDHELSTAFVEAGVAAGLKRNDDFNGAEQEGVGLYQVTCRKGRRWSVADAYIHPADARPNLVVRTEAFVTRIVLEDDRADLDAMISGFRTALEVLRQGPIARFVDEPWVPASTDPSDDEIVDGIGRLGQTLYHPVATCAMGTVDGSVVDPELRVHGVEGLRVADASVMPRVPRDNTNAPTIMIGEKCADLIKES